MAQNKTTKSRSSYKPDPKRQATRKRAKLVRHCASNPFDRQAHDMLQNRYDNHLFHLSSKGNKIAWRAPLIQAKREAHREAMRSAKHTIDRLSLKKEEARDLRRRLAFEARSAVIRQHRDLQSTSALAYA